MERVEKLVMPAALAFALLPACGPPKEHTAPAQTGTDMATEPSTTTAVVPAPAGPPLPRNEVYGTLMFKTEEEKVRTSACLSLDEIPPQADYDGTKPVFEALLKVIFAKDENAYDAMTVAEQSSKGKKCPSKMKEFFTQMEGSTLLHIDHVYEFDNIVLVDAAFRMPAGRDITFAFAFERSPDGKLLYAPCSERTRTYAVVRSWLSDPRAGDDFSPRCPADVVERATHRVPFGPDPARAMALVLRGAPVAEPGDLAPTAAKVTATLKALGRAVAAKDMRSLQKHMAKKGAEIAEWWRTAPAKDREAYAEALTGVEPFFIFDASPLVIAYVRHKDAIQVMYFVPNADGRLIWTNSALITDADPLFKGGPLLEAASLPIPFSTYRIN